MRKHLFRKALISAGAATLLGACGEGGGNGGIGGGSATTDVPFSAQQDISGLVAYMKNLIATRTDETSEPLFLGNAVLPTSETSEPLPVN